MSEIKLGDRVRDSYTKFEGVATGRFMYLYGCTRIYVEPTELKDGKPIDGQTFDEQRLELVRPEPIINNAPAVKTGGPNPADRAAVRR